MQLEDGGLCNAQARMLETQTVLEGWQGLVQALSEGIPGLMVTVEALLPAGLGFVADFLRWGVGEPLLAPLLLELCQH